jgi:putative sporulation protein YtaF
MWILSSVMFGISSCLDAFILGMCQGIRGIHIKISANIAISLLTVLGTSLSVIFGGRLLTFIPAHAAGWFGGLTLIAYGIFYIMKFMIKAIKKCINHKVFTQKISYEQCEACKTCCAHSTPGFVLIYGISLSMNNIGIGLGAGIAGLKLVPAALSTLFFSVIFLYTGNNFGRSRLSFFLGEAAEPLSGLLLLALGVWEIIF